MPPRTPASARRRRPLPSESWVDVDSDEGVNHDVQAQTTSRRMPAFKARRSPKVVSLVMPDPSIPSSAQKSSKKARNQGLNQAPGVRGDGLAAYSWLWNACVLPLVVAAFDLARLMFRIWKPLIWFLLALMLPILTLYYSSAVYLPRWGALAASSARVAAVSAVCHVPPVSWAPFCRAPVNEAPPKFQELMEAQGQLDRVAEEVNSELVIVLPHALKAKESALRDLRYLVEHSSLPSRQSLALEIDGFVSAAKTGSQDLSRFNSKLTSTIEGVLITNKWTLEVLDAADRQATERTSQPYLTQIVQAVNPLAYGKGNTDVAVRNAFLTHTEYLSDQVSMLIQRAKALLDVFNEMEDRLERIAELAHRDGLSVKASQDDLFGDLLTYLGANGGQRRSLNKQKELLKDVRQRRDDALRYLNDIFVKLLTLESSLIDLQDRTARPSLDEAAGRSMPIRLYLESTRLGAERLERVRDEGNARMAPFKQSLHDQIWEA